MDRIQSQIFTHLLLAASLAALEDVNIPLHFQDAYPGCKNSQDKPDMSLLPECNRSKFLHEMAKHKPDFTEYALNTSDLYECFTQPNTSITLSAALNGSLTFNGTILSTGRGNCQNRVCLCKLFVRGPPETFFEIQRYSLEAYTKRFPPTLRNVLNSTLSVREGTQAEFVYSFQAVPDCERHLQIRCISATSGTIETFGWKKGTAHSFATNSCVTLHVPQNHVTMISLVSIIPEHSQDGSSDHLFIYETSSCGGDVYDVIRNAADLTPRLLNKTGFVSFRYTAKIRPLRFRVLYSFHSRTQQPRQLPNGRWECSVDYYSSFQQHFACHPESYCVDKTIQVLCAETELCGANVIKLDGKCYQFFQPLYKTSWTDAFDVCSRKAGRLVVLKEASTQQKFCNFLAVAGIFEIAFVGLTMPSYVTSQKMYQYTWFWEDDTLAVSVQHIAARATPGYCAALYMGTLIRVQCAHKRNAAIICEKEDNRLQPKNLTKISLSPVPVPPLTNMTTCEDFQVTHAFLECDVSADCNADDMDESITCSNAKDPPVPFFTCRSQVERVPYTLVCDFRRDCCDGSDEDFCKFPACHGADRFLCADGKQCIGKAQWCDKRRDCLDGSDEDKCEDTIPPIEYVSKPPAKVDFTGTGYLTVQSLYNSSCPKTHYQCPDGGYCMPVYTRCNGVNDCPGKEDEKDCDHYTCPGFYRCRNSKVCLHQSHLCDDIFQCPERDDELLCSLKCPSSCTCYGYAFICSDPPAVDFDSEVRYLDVGSGNVHPSNITHNTKLIHLSLRYCSIKELGQLDFPNLQTLDLSHNDISVLGANSFAKLNNLYFLSLAYNPLSPHDPFFHAHSAVSTILYLNLSGIEISDWYDGFLKRFVNLVYLNMSNCKLMTMSKTGFQTFTNLYSLDVQGCPMETFFPHVFDGLGQLNYIAAENYELCCPGVMPEGMRAENCKAPSDEISSCDDLLRTDVFRAFLALYASLSLIGNLGSFIYRVFFEKSAAKIGYEVFVTHLSVADFLMGVYLAIIGVADRIYSGNYLWKDVEWRESAACKLAGSLSLLSSEVSACLICLITFERFLVMRFPHKHLRFSQRVAHAASMAVWLMGLVLALIPLLPSTSFWRFYSQSGICIPLPITRNRFPGMDYSFAVMIVMNLVLFLFIAVGQILIYWSIRSNTVACFDAKRKARERTVARRLLAVVMTDFLCWFPIGLLGVMARSGVPVPGEFNVAMAIFVLPFNSALNPFLYTLNAIKERRQGASCARKYRVGKETLPSRSKIQGPDPEPETKDEEISYSSEEAFQLFREYLEDGLLTHEQVRRRIRNNHKP